MSFRAVGESVRYSGPFLTVVRAAFESPEGEPFEREFLRHIGAVAAVPVIGDDVILVCQFRAAVGREMLEIPAGLLDVEGEDLEVAMARELEEEAGLRSTGAMELLVEYFPAAGMADHRVWIYLARHLEACESRPHGPEEHHMTVERLALDDAIGLIASGEIVDGKTIVGLLLARDRLA